MYILSLDTSNKFQLSLLNNKDVVDSISLDRSFFVKEKSNMSDVILQHISDMLKKRNISIKDIDCIAVINGSGYFTGIRISIVVAKMLKLSLKVPVYTFKSSYIIYKEVEKNYKEDETIIVALDIGKNGCVLSVFNKSNIIIEDVYIDEEGIENFFKENINLNSITANKFLIVGYKQHIFKELNYFKQSKYAENIVVPSVDILGKEAFLLYNKGIFHDTIEPFYAKEVDMIIKS